MRIILGLAAGMAAMAIGSAAAAARPGGTGSGHGGSPPGAWSNGGGHHAGKAGRTRFGTGTIEADRGHGRYRGRFRHFSRQDFLPYAGAGIGGSFGALDPYGNGFFNGGGGRIRLQGGQPYYDYDRAYPYEWAPAAAGRVDAPEEKRAIEPAPRCTVENSVRVCRGWR
jgi:hypothetical protein